MARRGWFRHGRGAARLLGAALVAGLAAGALPGAPVARAGEPIDGRSVDRRPAQVSTTPVATSRTVWHGPRTERVVALTFDDGWNPRTVRRVYQVLLREQVPATFFVTGIYVQRAPDLWRRIAASGFGLANHSYLHRDARSLTPRQLAADTARSRAAVEAATGRPMLPAYRPPAGNHTAATDAVVAGAGFPMIVLWDVSGGDAVRGATTARVVRDASAGRPGSIVLLHAGPSVTPRALPAIIARYRARGYRFVTLEELLGSRAGWATGPGTVAAGSRLLDRAEPGRRPGIGGTTGAAGEEGAGPVVVASAAAPSPPATAAPAAAAPATTDPPAAARDAAWARRDATPTTVALFTAALLGLLVLLGAAVGRSARVPQGGATGDQAPDGVAPGDQAPGGLAAGGDAPGHDAPGGNAPTAGDDARA